MAMNEVSRSGGQRGDRPGTGERSAPAAHGGRTRDEEILKILHVEDDPVDAELVSHALEADGLRCEFVRTASLEQFEREIDGSWDLILSDFSLPGFDGISAQQIATARRPEVPFVFVSGTMGEEVAVERLKQGATDYVLKHRLVRLPSAVRRALDEARERRERQEAEAEVRRLNEELEQRVIERTAQLAHANAALEHREAELADAKAFLEGLLAASPSMIFRLEPGDLRITYASPNIGWLLGYSPEEASAEGFFEKVIHPDDRLRVVDNLRRAMDTTVAQIEQEYRCSSKDGRYRWFFNLLRIDYDADARPVAVLGYALDICDRKAAEEAASRSALEAERANRAKSEFLSRMSHDLRTPLNAILGFAQLLEFDEATPEHADSIRQILNGGRHLLRLINEVLDVASIEAGRLTLTSEAVDVGARVQETLQLLRPLADVHGIVMKTAPAGDDAVWVAADRQRVTQVLLNIVGNAVKYNRPGGAVTVSWRAQPDGYVRIGVADTGHGIPEDRMRLLFQPFERLGAEHSRTEGTGLGLALSHGLTLAMGGRLSVESAVGQGTTFWVDLPAAASPRESAQGPPEPVEAPRTVAVPPGMVLYIEDNPANVRLVERLLARRTGLRLFSAGTGAQGLRIARTARPALILLDLHLPDQSGEDVLSALHSDPLTSGVPVIVLSAYAMPAQREALLGAGAAGYLTKPLDVNELLRLMDAILMRRGGM